MMLFNFTERSKAFAFVETMNEKTKADVFFSGDLEVDR